VVEKKAAVEASATNSRASDMFRFMDGSSSVQNCRE